MKNNTKPKSTISTKKMCIKCGHEKKKGFYERGCFYGKSHKWINEKDFKGKTEYLTNKCELCGEPMPKGEEMFNYHGYSGDCPKPPLNTKPKSKDLWEEELRKKIALYFYNTNSLESYTQDEIEKYEKEVDYLMSLFIQALSQTRKEAEEERLQEGKE